ncbi:hypothetical protein Tco_1110673 [Tanacetum coccineum]|uniref:Uncharacterized protein n=1 Tax=Tanacetum coccineum TaxID=301880 RepID=A0ABQ5IKY6_9ASTR
MFILYSLKAYDPHANKDSQETGASLPSINANHLSGVHQKQFHPNNQLWTSTPTQWVGGLMLRCMIESDCLLNPFRGRLLLAVYRTQEKMESQITLKIKLLQMDAKEKGDVLDAEAEALPR